MSKKQRSVSTKVSPTFANIQKGVPATSEFNPDYSHTMKELKKIVILAASFFVILIALSFVIK